MYSKAVYNIVHSEMSQVSTLHKQSPHVPRHTFATTLLNNGADINAGKICSGIAALLQPRLYPRIQRAK